MALAISTTKAEYATAGRACQQALWMKQAMKDYDIHCKDVLNEHLRQNHYTTCKGVEPIFSTFNASNLELTDTDYAVLEHGVSSSHGPQIDLEERIE
ncbi:hypothetical protein Tco_0014764 [Tanacetum coccineum]